jgi:hypothetical protein
MVDPLPKDPDVCPCGRLLHYPDAVTEAGMRRLVQRFGYWITVRLADGRAWRVPRHFLALHLLQADELPALAAQYGWPPLVALLGLGGDDLLARLWEVLMALW